MRWDHLAVTAIIAVGVGSSAIAAQETPAASEPYCQLFSKVRDNLSGNFGTRVDPLTRLSGIEVICAHKAVVFRQDVDLRPPEIDEDWIARRTRHWSKTYCHRHPAFASAIRNGWTISTVLTLADGSALRIDAACYDGEA